MAEQTILRAHPGAHHDLTNVSDDFVIELIYNSLGFEHNYVSLDEVKDVLAGRKEEVDEKKVNLIVNHYQAFDFILNLVITKQKFDENTLKDLHQVLMGKDAHGGLYRNVDISIRGSNHTPPGHIKVYDRMKKYFLTLEQYEGDTLEMIAYGHLQLAKIHPFLDGNGRCARLVLNYFLMINGYKPIIVYLNESKTYFNALEEFKVNKNIQPFVEYLEKKVQ